MQNCLNVGLRNVAPYRINGFMDFASNLNPKIPKFDTVRRLAIQILTKLSNINNSQLWKQRRYNLIPNLRYLISPNFVVLLLHSFKYKLI